MTNITDTYFSIRSHKSTLILELDYMLFLEHESYSHKEKLEAVLDEIENDTTVDVLVFSNNHPNYSLERYREKWDGFYNGAHWESNILRVFRTYDELFLKIKAFKKAIIFMNYKLVNSMLFNFSMVADLRFITKDFIIDNNNKNMVNIPKGSSIFGNASSTYKNPFKLMFLLTKIEAETLNKRQLIDEVCSAVSIEAEVLKVADHLATFDYIELETIKIIDHNRMSITECKLQEENEFLLSCIRTKINQ